MLNLSPKLHVFFISDGIQVLVAAWKPVESQITIPFPGLGDGIPIRSARAAVIVAIQALGIRPGSRIGVPLYCCLVVFKAIRAAGCAPRFLDIDPETFGLSSEDLRTKRSGIDALIAVHMFENLCDIPKVLEIMEGKPVIEDCAQSLGSRLPGGLAGSSGTIVAFSFRSGKYLSVGEGGALFTANPDLRTRLSAILEPMPAPTHAQECSHVFQTFARSKLRSKPLWGILGYRLLRLFKKVEFAAKSPVVLSRIFKSDLVVTRHRLKALPAMIEGQRTNAEYYAQHLQLGSSILGQEPPGAYYNRYNYPIIFPSTAHRDFIAAFLQDRLVGTAKPYEDAIDGAARHYTYEQDCPVAERLLKTTLVIPCHYRLKKADIAYIAQSLNNGWMEMGGASRGNVQVD